jgi:hypothetical protein
MLVAVTWFGILVGITAGRWKRGSDIMDALVLSIFSIGAFEVLYSLSIGGKVTFMHPIPFLYTAYFLGRLVDPRDFERYLPYVFSLGILFIFLTTLYDVLLFMGQKFRFGTRTAFFSPVGIVFGIYMFNVESAVRKKLLFLLVVVLSIVVLVLFGNRTAYLSLFVLLGALLVISRVEGKLRPVLITMGSMVASGTLSVVGLGVLYAGPLFIIRVVNRFASIFTRLGKGQDTSVLIRKYDIANAIERWSWEPFFGRSLSASMLRSIEGSTLMFVDNTFVTILWKYGAIGLTVFLTFLLYSAHLIWELLKRERTPFTLLLAFNFVNLLMMSISTSVFTTYVHVASLSVLLGVASTKLASHSAV